MYSYPYAAPVPPDLAWTGDAVGLVFMVAGILAVATLLGVVLRAGRQRVEPRTPIVSILRHSVRLPRVAA